jgi:capsular exopolysaccharide synthesis family protein
MSRIQDILARAERDGTARRTQTAEAAYGGPAVHGTSALEPTPFLRPVDAIAPPIAAPAPPINGAATAPAAAATAVAEARTAQATLHPALVVAIAPHSAVAEQYRAMRQRITLHEEQSAVRTVMVTSPGAGEGKSITAANLALTMAQEFQRRVLLVDTDLRGPSVHALFGLDGTPGLAEVLAGEATLDEALVYLPDYRLTVLAAGATPDYPTELLGSTAMRRTLDTLRARFDRVLLDLPAVMPLADVGTVAPLADGVVMVVRAGVTQRPALDQALAAFEENKVLGVVLNEVR